jgi:transporter family-2 protein
MKMFILIGLAAAGIVAGGSAVLQQVLVANLRTALASPYWAVLISYIGGTITMVLVVLAAREPMITSHAIAKSSTLSWIGGVFGVIYIVVAILLIPRLGAATVLALLVTGQLLASILFDHLGLFGLPKQPVDAARIAGAAMLIGGVLLIRR